MPRRSQTRASNLQQTATATSSPPPTQNIADENLLLLRRQWKWAAFSQFYFTFSSLFNLNDVTISDIERDLTNKSNIAMSKVMHKLLFALSNDRKVSTENWQTALRKQYNKRDPQANPIGPDPKDLKKDIKEKDEEELHLSEPVGQSSEQGPGQEASAEARETSTSLEPTDVRLPEGSRQTSVAEMSGDVKPEPTEDGEREAEAEVEAEEMSTDWFDLPMLIKLDSLHTLAEWQFQNPFRLRTMMKSDDEFASWRIEPIGYDSKKNAYWFIGAERLWIQRVPPKPPRSQASKRKRSNNKADGKTTASKAKPPPQKRARLDANISSASVDSTPVASGRHSRAAKDQAKIRLDLQAKELAKINRDATRQSHKTQNAHSSPAKQQSSRLSSRVVGTRTSARLRGAQDDEWQPIPSDWLNSSVKPKSPKSTPVRTGLESDEETISDLTELSEDGDEGTASTAPKTNGTTHINGDAQKSDSLASDEMEKDKSQAPPTDFIEWETICVTLQEWEHFPQQFEHATHYSEKALYKILANEIVPAITHELREIERKRELEEALVHRKRSSRLALRESEREEARLAAKRKQEEDEKFSRARRMEARSQKEEAERIKRENAREQRRKEREAREDTRRALTAQEAMGKSKSTTHKAEGDPRSVDARPADVVKAKNGNHSGSRTPVGEDWELACEICQRHGINLDDGIPMMSCGICSKWQHIHCHDRADQAAGRPRRNWDSVDFICRRCRASRQESLNNRAYPPPQHYPAPTPSQVHSYRSYPPESNPSPNLQPYNPYYGNRETQQQQSFYMRPTNLQPRNQSQYPNVASTTARPTISFSHYQPAAHGFSTSQQPYNETPTYHPPPTQQQYRPTFQAPYKVQTNSAWNITTPSHTPGYNLPHNGAAAPSHLNAYRDPSYDQQQRIPVNEHLQAHSNYTDQQYQSSHYRQLPSSYQPPLGQ